MFNGGSKNNPAISCSKKNRIMNYLKVDNVNNTDLPEFIYCYIITGQAGFKETEIQPKKKKFSQAKTQISWQKTYGE